ncbi:hypothetical protein BN136_3463 [Cronobacter universalis NCTC 9529]|nr:hypothetical protein BN136_3463 [Cronobacter universalis NCTC 9529]
MDTRFIIPPHSPGSAKYSPLWFTRTGKDIRDGPQAKQGLIDCV